MSYKKIGTSAKDKLLKKYDMYLSYQGTVYRKRVKCPKTYIEKIHSEWLNNIYSGEYHKPQKLKNIIDEYSNIALPTKSHDEIMRFNRAIKILDPIKNKNINDIKNKDFQELLMSNGYENPYSFNRQINTLSTFLNWCDRQGYRVSSKLLHGLRKPEPESKVILLNNEQIKIMMSRCKLQHQKTFILLALFTGMRHGEILKLRWSDINIDNSYITLSGIMTKSKKTRHIPLIPHLKEYLNKLTRECDYVVSYLGKKIITFKKSWVYIGKDICRIHDLRHHFATVLLNAGVSRVMVQRALGHSTPKMTDHYSAMSPEMITKNIDNFAKGFYNIFATDNFFDLKVP